MSSRVIMFLGAVLAALLIYLCIATKKEEIAAALMPVKPVHTVSAQPAAKPVVPRPGQPTAAVAPKPKKLASAPKPKPAPAPKAKESDTSQPLVAPSFAYIGGKVPKITAFVSKKDSGGPLFEELKNYCATHKCAMQVEAQKRRAPAHWEEEALEIVTFMQHNAIPQASLMIDGQKVTVDGLFTDKEKYAHFTALLDRLKKRGFQIDDRSYLQEVVSEPAVEAAQPQTEANPTEAKIADILTREPIMFELNSVRLTPHSKRTLNKVAKLLDQEHGVSIEVAGYTDATGSASYNKILSQRRAEAVKRYLRSRMKEPKEIVARGYGATNFIIDNPKDRRNRRVEIYLLK